MDALIKALFHCDPRLPDAEYLASADPTQVPEGTTLEDVAAARQDRRLDEQARTHYLWNQGSEKVNSGEWTYDEFLEFGKSLRKVQQG